MRTWVTPIAEIDARIVFMGELRQPRRDTEDTSKDQSPLARLYRGYLSNDRKKRSPMLVVCDRRAKRSVSSFSEKRGIDH